MKRAVFAACLLCSCAEATLNARRATVGASYVDQENKCIEAADGSVQSYNACMDRLDEKYGLCESPVPQDGGVE